MYNVHMCNKININNKFSTNLMNGLYLTWKNLYIDASHPDETRVVLKQNLILKNMNTRTKIV